MQSYQYDRDIQLNSKFQQPLDTISQILWSQNSKTFWTVGWDAYARYYSIQENYSNESLQQLFSIFLQQPITCCSWDERNNLLFTGHINGQIKIIELNNSNIIPFVRLDVALCKIFWIPQINVLISFGFQNKMEFWDLGNPVPKLALKLEEKTIIADIKYPYVIICNIYDRIAIINLNSNDIGVPPYQEIVLEKYSKVNCLEINRDGTKFIAGTMDGRCSVHTFQISSNNNFKLKSEVTFKGQFKKEYPSKFTLYPITAVGFNRLSPDWLFVAGGQPSIAFYSLKSKDLIKDFKFRSPISAAKCSPCGTYLAYSCGPIWMQGLKELGMYDSRISCHRIKSQQRTKI